MKRYYLDIILKAAMIALFITHISNTISIIAFSLYCLFQQSGTTFFTIGEPHNILSRAELIDKIDQKIKTKYEGKYTLDRIIKAIDAIQKTKTYSEFRTIATWFKQYLNFKGEQVKNIIPIENAKQAIARQVFLSHNEHGVEVPTDFVDNVIESCELPPAKIKPALFNLPFPHHFQILIEQTNSGKLGSSTHYKFQLGNQYNFKTHMNSQSFQYYCIGIALAFVAYIASPSLYSLIPAVLSFGYAASKHTSDDYLTFNIGHDPRSPASNLYQCDPSNNQTLYSIGNISFNALVNLAIFYSFSFFGAANILNMIPLYAIAATAVFTLYDRVLAKYNRTPLLKHPAVNIRLKGGSRRETIAMAKPSGFNLPSLGIIRPCHKAAFKLSHLL